MPESESRGGQGTLQLAIRSDQLLSFAAYVWRRFAEDRGWRMAAGLSYTSLLAIVPLTAIAFSMLAAFPVFDSVKDQLQSAVFANLLPDSAVAIQDYVDGFVENTAGLSAIGIVALAATAVLLLGTIEADLNSIFRIRRPRALAPRLLVFWAMITLGPLLMGMSFSLSTYFFAATEWLGIDIFTGPLSLVTRSVPTMIVIVMLAVFYFTIPNRPVNALDALIGGLVAGLLFAALGAFDETVVSEPVEHPFDGAVADAQLLEEIAPGHLGAGAARIEQKRQDADRRDQAWPGAQLPFHRPPAGASPSAQGRRHHRAQEHHRPRQIHPDEKNRHHRQRPVNVLVGGEGRHVPAEPLAQRGGWVLIRDLASVTLYDLYQALKLGLRDEDMDLAGEGDDGWHQRLADCLRDLKAAQRDATDVSLRELIEGEALLAGAGGSGVSEAPVRKAG